MIDFSSELGKRALERLQSEEYIWLTVVDSANRPIPNPVWFIWQENHLLIYSKPDAKRLKHIAANPNVSLNFNGDAEGGDIIVFSARAEIDTSIPPSATIPAYVEKYREGVKGIGMTVESLSSAYSAGFRVYPLSVRGF
jgi:PPOX class probable F420-dependent enzyme